uniref:Uncharacterized protein n=1 Tax=Romanomermis culicivorax TaxID=13658 RepID=A0A915KQC4_ROMCU
MISNGLPNYLVVHYNLEVVQAFCIILEAWALKNLERAPKILGLVADLAFGLIYFISLFSFNLRYN